MYVLYVCFSYCMYPLVYLVHISVVLYVLPIFLCSKKVLVCRYAQHTYNIYTYIQNTYKCIFYTYKNTCKYMQIHACQLGCPEIHIVCMCMYFMGSAYVYVCMVYVYVFVCTALGECNPFCYEGAKKHIHTHTFTYMHIHAHILSYIQIQHDTSYMHDTGT